MLIIGSLIAAVVPMIIYLMIIWRFDRYDREPFGLILRNYLWGGLGAIFFAIIGSDILSSYFAFFISNEDFLSHIQVMLIAPFVEELTKGFFLFITIRNKKFDNITDGIVYGGAIGLGFGMTENFLYFITYGNSVSEWILIVVIRTLFSGVMHCVSTGTLGAFIGYAKFKGLKIRLMYPVIGLGIAMFIHFAWNFTVSFQSTAVLGFLFMIITICIFIVVFSLSLNTERKIIYNELFEEAQTGLIPVEHIPILNSSMRNRFGWVDERVRKLYIMAATTLAFRKMQYKNVSGYEKLYCEKEIEHYRTYISDLLTNSSLTE